MHDVAVIDDPVAAEVSLDPVCARLLAELPEPGSATTLAQRVGLTGQKVDYRIVVAVHPTVRREQKG